MRTMDGGPSRRRTGVEKNAAAKSTLKYLDRSYPVNNPDRFAKPPAAPQVPWEGDY